jgi:hypothetical protein
VFDTWHVLCKPVTIFPMHMPGDHWLAALHQHTLGEAAAADDVLAKAEVVPGGSSSSGRNGSSSGGRATRGLRCFDCWLLYNHVNMMLREVTAADASIAF